MILKNAMEKNLITKADLAEILYEYIKYKPENSQSCWKRHDESNKELIQNYEKQKILGRLNEYSDAQYEYSMSQVEFIKSKSVLIGKIVNMFSNKMNKPESKAVAIQKIVNGFESKEDLIRAINMVSSDGLNSAKTKFVDKNTVNLIYNVVMSKKDPALKPIALKSLNEKILLKTTKINQLEQNLRVKKYESDKIKEFDETLIRQTKKDLLFLNEKKKEIESVKDQDGIMKDEKSETGTNMVKVVKEFNTDVKFSSQVDKKPKVKEI